QQHRAFTTLSQTQSVAGESSTRPADSGLKWPANGNASVPNLNLQGEYFRRKESGALTFDTSTGDYSSQQSGWYAQAVYQFMPRWRVGYRYDRLDHGTVTNGLGLTAQDAPLLLTDYNPTRNTAMVDSSLTQFSRFRLQYAVDKSPVDLTDNQIPLQYILSLGAHGAHKF